MGAVELAGEQVGVVADALAVPDIRATPFQHLVGLLPECLLHQGGHNSARFILEEHPLLRGKKFLLFGKQVDDLDLVARIVALVLRIGEDTGHGGVRQLFAVVVPVALRPEAVLQLFQAVLSGGIELEQLPHHGGLLRVDDQPALVLAVAEDAAVAQHHPVFDGLLMTKLHPAG